MGTSNRLVIRKSWANFLVLCFIWSAVAVAPIIFLLPRIYSNSLLIIILGINVFWGVLSICLSLPGNCLTIDQNGITCEDYRMFKKRSSVHYEWDSFDFLIYHKGEIYMRKGDDVTATIKISKYSSLFFEYNGKNRLALYPSIVSGLLELCKEIDKEIFVVS